jgi:hypothetical protein
VNNRAVFHSGGSKPNCAAPLFNQRDSAVNRARGAFIVIVASAVVGYALKRLQGRRAGLWSISL